MKPSEVNELTTNESDGRLVPDVNPVTVRDMLVVGKLPAVACSNLLFVA